MTTRKTQPPNPATATSASKVVPLRESVPAIEPEEGWTKATTEGEHLIAGQGDGERRLVQLSTVFRWAAGRSDAPPCVALEQALALVADIPAGALYLVQKEGWPAAFTAGQALPGFEGAEFVDLNASPPAPHGYGNVALVALMRQVWVGEQKGQISAEPLSFYDSDLPGAHEYLCRFAVSFPVAHSLWGWGRVAVPALDAVAKPEHAPATFEKTATLLDTSDGSPPWLTERNYNLAWLFGEREKFQNTYGDRGHYMKKLVVHLKELGVVVPGKDPAREIRRLVDVGSSRHGKKASATFVSGLGGRKSGGHR